MSLRDGLPLCLNCAGNGFIRGIDGILPDLECPKCLKTGVDWSKYIEKEPVLKPGRSATKALSDKLK